MDSIRDLPRNAQRLIQAVVAGGSVCVLARVPELAHWNRGDVFAWLGLSFACALLEQFTVAIPHEEETENYSLTDALWVPALVFAPPSVLTFAVFAGVLIGHGVRRWAWYKVAFNVGQFVVAVTAAELVYGLFRLPPPITLMTWLAATVAMIFYFSLNEVLVAGILSAVEGASIRSLIMLPEGLNLVQAGGNLTIGLLATLVWSTGPIGIPLLVAPMVLSFLAYRGWAHTRREEQQERDRKRMQALYEAGRALLGPLDVIGDFQPFLELVKEMVDADFAEIVIVDDRVRVYDSERGPRSDVGLEGPVHAPEHYLGGPDPATAYLAAIGDGREISGVLAVHRHSRLSPAESSLIETLASQVQVRLKNERLFLETLEQRGHLADVIGNTSDGIFVVSPDGTLQTWNPAMHRITGYTRDEAVGHLYSDVLALREDSEVAPPDDAPGLSIDHGDTRDALVLRKDGSSRWIRYTSSSMPDRGGGARAFVVVVRDVTAELETERMKNDFIATVSHELRSPLTPLKGFLGSLMDGLVDDSPDARGEYYGIMYRQVDRLEQLINDLLEVSRIEAGKLSVEPKALDVAVPIEECLRDLRRETTDRRFEFTAIQRPVTVLADPFRVEQILTNLLTNAAKYSPHGAPVRVTLRTDGGHALVSVHNEGDGIPPADRERVFDRFYRAETGLARETGGFGLGLYICRKLVEAMGGKIWVDSEPGHGCTFSFVLPLLPTNAELPEQGSQAPSAVGMAGNPGALGQSSIAW